MKEITINIDEKLYEDFEVALKLNSENKDEVIAVMLRNYISQAFSRIAQQYAILQTEGSETMDANYGKAIRKISVWAKRNKQVPHKIIRAYFQLEKEGTVTYEMLTKHCSDEVAHPDVYVPTFASNFAQMKIDAEKSHGKVFEVNSDGVVIVWSHVKDVIERYKQNFVQHTTDEGYLNQNNQRNIGKTDEPGTDHMQVLYIMRCEDCAHEYFANGTDIFLKKCPKCQRGVDTGV